MLDNTSQGIPQTPALLNLSTYSSISDFNTPITNFNQHYNAEQAFLLKLPRKWELKATTSFTTGKNQMFQAYTQGFILPNSDTVKNTERYALAYKPLYTDIHTYLSKLKSKHLIRWISGFNYSQKFHFEQIVFNEQPYFQQLRTFKKTVFQNVEYTYQITKKQAIRVLALFQTDFDFVQYYYLNRNQFFTVLQDTGYANIYQTIRQPYQNAKLNVIYNTNYRKYYFTANIGAEQQQQHIQSFLFTDYSTFFTGTSTLNQVGKLLSQRIYVYMQHKYQQQNYAFSLTTETGHLNFIYQTKEVRMPYTLPQVSASYNKKPLMTSFSYERKLEISPFDQVFGGYILRNFQNASIGLGRFNLSPIHKFSFTNFFTPGQGKFKWNTMLLYSIIQRPVLYRNLLDNTVATQNQIAFVGKEKSNTMLIFNTNVSQYIKQITSALREKYSFNQLRYFNLVNGVERVNTTYSHNYAISMGSGFKLLNYYAELQQRHSYSVAVGQSGTNTRQYNQTTHLFLDLSCSLFQKFRAGISNEYLIIRGQKLQAPYFASAFAEYQKNHFCVGIKIHNLLNNSQFREINLTDFSYTIENQRLMPRYIQLQVSYSLGKK